MAVKICGYVLRQTCRVFPNVLVPEVNNVVRYVQHQLHVTVNLSLIHLLYDIALFRVYRHST